MRKIIGSCKVSGCKNRPITRQMCKKHYILWWKWGSPENINTPGQKPYIRYEHTRINGILMKKHVAIAEKVLGKKLPRGAVIHHVDEDGMNNSLTNLVICPSQAYHSLLHRRARELEKYGRCISTEYIYGTPNFASERKKRDE